QRPAEPRAVMSRMDHYARSRHAVSIRFSRHAISICFSLLALPLITQAETVTVGSKKFTESFVLGEIAKKLLTDAGFQVNHKQGLGNTTIVWNALKAGDI